MTQQVLGSIFIVDDRGRIKIPSDILSVMGVRPGDEMNIYHKDGEVRIRKIKIEEEVDES